MLWNGDTLSCLFIIMLLLIYEKPSCTYIVHMIVSNVLSIRKNDYMVPMSFVSHIIRCLRENDSCYGMVINCLASLQCARSL